MTHTVDYKQILVDCGWNKAFTDAITDFEAMLITGIEDIDAQLAYAEMICRQHKLDYDIIGR